MYKKPTESDQLVFKFYLPFGGKLDPKNRWVVLSSRIPWGYVEEVYQETLSGSDKGCPALSGRTAFGALVIKERLGTSDRETVAQVRENPYLQYFLGLKKYSYEAPFDDSMMTHFRKRLTKEILQEINERIVSGVCASEEDHSDDSISPPSSSGSNQDGETRENKGKLIIDATCTPADITYPTDLKLLNESREKTEEIIDIIHEPDIGEKRKPRTYRKRAHKEYIALAKQRQPGIKKLRKGIRKQLGYIKRNLKTIDTYARTGRLELLSRRLYRLLLVIHEVYRQQQWMYDNRSHRMPDRIVNLHQPHVRPIVRGKAGTPVEFGAKISVSLVDGFSHVDRLGWNPYNESKDFIPQVEAYKRRYGCYPEAVQTDKIYRTRANRKYCRKHGIRLSGPPLGRPPKETEANKEKLKALRDQQQQDERERQAIEGKFGQGKRRFTLSRIMAKLAETSEAVIMVSFIVMNLEKILRDFLLSLFSLRDMSVLWLRNALNQCRGGEFCWPNRFGRFHVGSEKICGAA